MLRTEQTIAELGGIRCLRNNTLSLRVNAASGLHWKLQNQEFCTFTSSLHQQVFLMRAESDCHGLCLGVIKFDGAACHNVITPTVRTLRRQLLTAAGRQTDKVCRQAIRAGAN